MGGSGEVVRARKGGRGVVDFTHSVNDLFDTLLFGLQRLFRAHCIEQHHFQRVQRRQSRSCEEKKQERKRNEVKNV